MGKIVFGYWNIRGVAEPCRYILRYKDIDFEDRQYDLSKREDWFNEKFTLGLDFPNIPYLIDGDVRMNQSIAILRYLARKYDLEGKTDEEVVRVLMVEQELYDLRTSFGKLCYDPDFEKQKDDVVAQGFIKLKQIVEFLGERKFLAGSRLTYVDFLAFETIDFFRYFIPRLLEDDPKLREYYDRIRSLPTLKKYLESSKYKAWPIYSIEASFGGSGPQPDYAV